MTEIVIAILASSGLWGVIQYLISRRDKTAEKHRCKQTLKKRISLRVCAFIIN